MTKKICFIIFITTMAYLNIFWNNSVIDDHIFIGKYRTAHRRNGDRVTLEPHLFNNLGNQLVNRTVAATRAVVHHVVRDEFRLAEYQVFLFDFYYFCHSLTFY